MCHLQISRTICQSFQYNDVVQLLLTTRKAEWYIILVMSLCLSDDNFRKP